MAKQLADTANIYIERYKLLVKDATNRLNKADQTLATVTDTLSQDKARFDYLEDLFKRLQNTDNSYKQIKEIIERSLILSSTIVKNIEFVTKAIELLMCSVQSMSQAADNLKDEIDKFKMLLNNLDKNNGLYKKLLELEQANNDAIKANQDAINKSLDTLKEIYILYVNMSGKMLHKINNDKKTILNYGHKGITHACGHENLPIPLDKVKGLESHFSSLKELLNKDSAYPTKRLQPAEKQTIPCAVDEKSKAVFPLNSSDSFYKEIENEKGKAEASQTFSKTAYQTALQNQNRIQAELAGYQAALKAAEDARKVTAG